MTHNYTHYYVSITYKLELPDYIIVFIYYLYIKGIFLFSSSL